ncbi:MAG TPA: DNA primase [Candidatus Saccharimonadales bacterium]|nr:DNA primase [Candidatus Saccharimonadales bacterium]
MANWTADLTGAKLKGMDAVSEVKARLSIEDVISEYVRLKRSGRNYKGLSPFTSEKTPSFMVSPEKQIWHDFSSGRGGDVFTFVQEVEGLDFKDALELLARKAGVDLEQYKGSSGGRPGIDKARLHEALKSAVKFYQSQLLKEHKALEYIRKKRGFSKQTMLDFELGYSPKSQKALADFLLKKGFKEKELQLTGLITRRGGRSIDMFRGRIMIPLHDSTGAPVGFTARLLEDDKNAPKYINTPATPLYDKSRHIYGLHMAKQAIRENDYSIIAEGNLDVISSHQAGFRQVVASAGTAMTEYQLKTLARFSPNVKLAFDQDKAGLDAAERSIPIASKVGIELSIITIPEGKDPDELIRKNVKLWEKAVSDAEYAVDWLINTYKDKFDLDSAQGKRKFSDKLAGVINELSDPVEQDHYVHVISDMTGVSEGALVTKLKGAKSEPPRLKKVTVTNTLPPKEARDRSILADRLLCLALPLPEIRLYLKLIIPQMLVTDAQIKLLEFLRNHPEFDLSASAGEHGEGLEGLEDYVKILVLQFEELYAKVDRLELQYEAAHLRAKIIEYFVKEQKDKLRVLYSRTDETDPKYQQILAKDRDLNQLLKQVKEA